MPEDIEFEDEPLDHAQIQRDAGMAAARIRPRSQEESPLGQRPIDEANEWHDINSPGLTRDDLKNFATTYRTTPVATSRSFDHLVPYESMSPEQQQVVDLCRSQIEEEDFPIKRVLVQGKAGTGKSAVIKAMCQMLHAKYGSDGYQVLAPTGAAALNVDGKTIHSFLGLPTQTELMPLNGEALISLQFRLKDLKFIIIDEYSMVGMRLFTKIQRRLQEAFHRAFRRLQFISLW